jgi:hypothetical protein
MKFRNIITNSDAIAFGCSHTWGTGVEADETWPYKLGAKNFGVQGCSSDFICRIFSEIIEEQKPTTVYILWPDWTRFEYIQDGQYYQSLPTDANRIKFMETHTNEWLIDNFVKRTEVVRDFCKNDNIELFDMTLYDLIPYIDRADTWPVSKLGHHNSPVWHSWVADIFKNAKNNNIKHSLRNE